MTLSRCLVLASVASLFGACCAVDLQLLQLTADAEANRTDLFTVQIELQRMPFGPGASKVVADHVQTAQTELNDCVTKLQDLLQSEMSYSASVTGTVGTMGGSNGQTQAHIFLKVPGTTLTAMNFGDGNKNAIIDGLCGVGGATNGPFYTNGWGNAKCIVTFHSGDSSTGAGNDQAASGKGDPHLTNMHGQRFDLMQPGVHVLIQVPRHALKPADTLLRVEADARRMGAACADLYFQVLTITGNWTDESGGLQFFANKELDNRDWRKFGDVDLKVIRGHTGDGIAYLNVFVKHLTRVKFPVGGLLGEDDHTAAATPGPECSSGVDLHSQGASFAMIEG